MENNSVNNLKVKLYFICTFLFPLLSIEYNDTLYSLQLYKFSFSFLLLLLFLDTFIVNLRVFIYYLLFVFIAVFFTLYSQIQVSESSFLSASKQDEIFLHAYNQLIGALAFITLILLIVSSSINKIYAIYAVKGYIVSITFYCLLSIIFYLAEIAGFQWGKSSESMGLYKLQGFLGEPKQFAAAMLSGFLLLKYSLPLNSFIFFKKNITQIRLSYLFFFSAIATLSTAHMVCISLVIWVHYFNKIIISKYVRLLAMASIFTISALSFGNCDIINENRDIGAGVNSIYNKLKSPEIILSYLPKDGVIISDLICRPGSYLIGGGAGSLYKKIITDDLSNYHWYKDIGIFTDIINGEPHSKEGPSLYQVIIVTDYGFLGLISVLLFLWYAQSEIKTNIITDNGVLFYFAVFLNSYYYLLFLICIHFFALKAMRVENHIVKQKDCDDENFNCNTVV